MDGAGCRRPVMTTMFRCLHRCAQPALPVLLATLYATTAAGQARHSEQPAVYTYRGADREQHLIDKARAEGRLTLYTSMSTTESGPLAQAFERKYGIKVALWRALSENVLQRALTESRAGRAAMDVVETNAPEVEALAREQAVGEFHSPHLSDLPDWASPPHRRWAADRANLWVVAYHTGKVKRDELPAAYEGFAEPKWK
jgi:iron(III) transport system substrate-binding protein